MDQRVEAGRSRRRRSGGRRPQRAVRHPDLRRVRRPDEATARTPLYNLECDRLLSPNFAVLGTATEADDEAFRERMANTKKFHTRKEFDQGVGSTARWITRPAASPSYRSMRVKQRRRGAGRPDHAGGNVLFYMATPPRSSG